MTSDPCSPDINLFTFNIVLHPILLRHPSNLSPVTITSHPHLAAPFLRPHFPEPSQAQYCIRLVTTITQGFFSYGTSPLPFSSSSPRPASRNGPCRCPPFIFIFLAGRSVGGEGRQNLSLRVGVLNLVFVFRAVCSSLLNGFHL